MLWDLERSLNFSEPQTILFKKDTSGVGRAHRAPQVGLHKNASSSPVWHSATLGLLFIGNLLKSGTIPPGYLGSATSSS